MFPTPLEWLRAGRRGVVILTGQRTLAVAGRKLIVANTDFGRRLRAMLRMPEPRVYVERRAA